MKVYIENSWCKVDLCGKAVPETLLKALSYTDKQQTFQSFRYTGQYIPFVKSLYMKRGNLFPTGLLPLVQAAMPGEEYIDLRVKPEIDWQPIPPQITEYREGHQEQVLTTMMEKCRGTIEGITAMGKTYVEAGFAAIFDKPLLILSHRKEIFDNIVAKCCDLIGSDDVGIINAKMTKPNRVTVAMVGSLSSRLPKLKKTLQQVTGILVDEAHHISVKSQYYGIIQSCNNAYYRFGLTASPFRDSGDTIALFAPTGPVISSYHYGQALVEGVVVPLDVYLIPNEAEVKLPILYEFNDVYEIGVVKNDERNNNIVKVVKKLYEKGENVLVLVWRIDHGRRISKLLEGEIEHEFVHGSSPNRDIVKESFERGDLPVLIASSIYDEGVNIERIQNIVNAAGYKSERLLIQRTGRGMRPFEGKERCRVFDFVDMANTMLAKHSKARIRYYKKMGFRIKKLSIS